MSVFEVQQQDMAQGDCHKKFYGKYRGTVVNPVDPNGEGRIQVIVPDVTGTGISSWAKPSLPFGGPNSGFFAVPPLRAGVWVEFEQGDPNFPIWSGCFWSNDETPEGASKISRGIPGLTMQTMTNNRIQIDDTPGQGITLESRMAPKS